MMLSQRVGRGGRGSENRHSRCRPRSLLEGGDHHPQDRRVIDLIACRMPPDHPQRTARTAPEGAARNPLIFLG